MNLLPSLQVLPVLFAVLHVCDEPLRELLLEQLVVLVMVVRQHIRRFLPDLLSILGEFWARSSKIQHVCLQVCWIALMLCCVRHHHYHRHVNQATACYVCDVC